MDAVYSHCRILCNISLLWLRVSPGRGNTITAVPVSTVRLYSCGVGHGKRLAARVVCNLSVMLKS